MVSQVLSVIWFGLEMHVGSRLVVDWGHVLAVLLLYKGELLLLEIDEALVDGVWELVEGCGVGHA